MSEIIFLVERTPEGTFYAKARGHSIFTAANSKDELKAMVTDAVTCHFEDGEAPALIRFQENLIHSLWHSRRPRKGRDRTARHAGWTTSSSSTRPAKSQAQRQDR